MLAKKHVGEKKRTVALPSSKIVGVLVFLCFSFQLPLIVSLGFILYMEHRCCALMASLSMKSSGSSQRIDGWLQAACFGDAAPRKMGRVGQYYL